MNTKIRVDYTPTLELGPSNASLKSVITCVDKLDLIVFTLQTYLKNIIKVT